MRPIRQLCVSVLVLGGLAPAFGGELPPEAAKLVGEFDRDTAAIRKKAEAEVQGHRDKLLGELGALKTKYAKADMLDEALAIGAYMKGQAGGKLPGDAAALVAAFDGKAEAIRTTADGELTAREDKLLKELRAVQSELTRKEQLDEAKAVQTFVANRVAPRKELEKLEGKWRYKGYVLGIGNNDSIFVGRRVGEEENAVQIRGGKIVNLPEFGDAEVVLTPGNDPPHIDLTITKGENKGKTLKGLYKLDGKQLTLCIGSLKGGTRPAALRTLSDGDIRVDLELVATFK